MIPTVQVAELAAVVPPAGHRTLDRSAVRLCRGPRHVLRMSARCGGSVSRLHECREPFFNVIIEIN